MAQPSNPTAPTGRPSGPGPYDSRGAWAAGGTVFAGVLLLVNGVLGIIKGIAGIAQDDVYSTLGQYVFKFDVTAWGWIHLIVGIVLVIVGAGILKGAAWARMLGVVAAACDLVLNFMWLPYTPLWALISIAINVFIIWALCTDRTGTRTA
ncbi:hypothetical protein [Streptomyces subrutilus]|uniref:DUF7144 domain-containing protein n=1 Tax=Streptomyces subrutilus TaxID=36818 RepID=A0A5P2UTQ1_9ACTN|nr:hypothetical protein [Streptomyces subrutilus]QEU81719.1 hypothetical protein CP968_28600 [Streptomyces subrutilus]WSJ28857.1 hypothetical protein OG479_05780 [Streptomyces subrutilus]GGZ80382.1 hypothetical protein GCM10010371_44900 [Streptomyces subrutilus]